MAPQDASMAYQLVTEPKDVDEEDDAWLLPIFDVWQKRGEVESSRELFLLLDIYFVIVLLDIYFVLELYIFDCVSWYLDYVFC